MEECNKLSYNYIVIHFSVKVNTITNCIFKYCAKVVLIISERKRPLSEYGVEVKVRLVKLNKTQKWLIEEVKKLLPETYLDTSNLYKIMTGEIKSTKIETAINEVLDINYTQNAENVNS